MNQHWQLCRLAERALFALLDASAHEIMRRSPWLFQASPAQKAAAAGYLAWRDACNQQQLVYATVMGPIIMSGIALRYAAGAR